MAIFLVDERYQGFRYAYRVICRLLVAFNCHVTNELIDERDHFGLSKCSREDSIVRNVKRDGRANRVRWDRSAWDGHFDFSTIRDGDVVDGRHAKLCSFRRTVYLVGSAVELVPCANGVRNVVYHGVGLVVE